jgi:hypothetical protein
MRKSPIKCHPIYSIICLKFKMSKTGILNSKFENSIIVEKMEKKNVEYEKRRIIIKSKKN